MKNLKAINMIPRRDFKMIVHIPSSIIDVEKGLLKKTMVAGLIGRACGIFRVDVISLYKDPDSSNRSMRFIKKILDYMRTPHYLRRFIIPLDRDLRGVGILPPLTTPNQISEEDLDKDHVREALVTKIERKVICLEAGLESEFCFKPSSRDFTGSLREGDIVLVAVSNRRIVDLIEKDVFLKNNYWSYDVAVNNSLRSSLERFRNSLIIISTRKGSYLTEDLARSIVRDLKGKDLSIVFGSPDKDPDEIAELEGWNLNELANYSINTAPLQGVRNIRTYEALFITLSLINNTIYISKGI